MELKFYKKGISENIMTRYYDNLNIMYTTSCIVVKSTYIILETFVCKLSLYLQMTQLHFLHNVMPSSQFRLL